MSKRTRARDRGMTLPEVLISVVLTGLICAALAMSITVVLRQTDNTTGRVNNARSEQSVSLWMPADLASAEIVDTQPGSLPCTLPCPPEANIGGSNALMLTWTSQTFDTVTGLPVDTTTKVSYRYMQDGDGYVLVRVECVTIGSAATTCSSQTVLHDLPAPPGDFIPGSSKPIWVIEVSQALDPASTGGTPDTTPVDPTLKNKNGQRVVVTINGGGDGAGAGGGTNQISLSAGGTERQQNLNPASSSGVPPFIAARSRCGGNFALVVDTSGSIGASNMGATISGTPNWSTVRGSIYKFIEAFQGTPVNLELVTFSNSASTLGTSGDGQKYYDMLDPTQVTALKALVGYPNTSGGLQSGGKTNWEDAFYQVFKKQSNGAVQPILPKMVIFFTDGVPTWSRLQSATPTPSMAPADVPLPGQDDDYYQVAWNRANRVMRQFDADVQNLIGMFVGSSSAQSPWVDSLGYHLGNFQRGYHNNPERGYHLTYEKGNNVVFQRGSHGTFERGNNVVWEKGYHDDYQRGNNVVWEKGYHPDYQRGNNVVWERGYHDDYQRGNNVVWERGYHDDYQRGNNVVWERGYHLTTFERNNNVVFERSGTGLTYEKLTSGTWQTGTWSASTATNYFATTGGNTTPDSTDGWRVRVTGALGSWTSSSPSFNQTRYDTTNTTTDSSDGFRTSVSGGLSGSWTTVTAAQYAGANTTADSTDGWRATKVYTAPFDTWETTTQSTYGSNNTTAAETDGWRTSETVTSTSWTSVTAAEYNASNLTSDATDGWQIAKAYTSPFSTWESTTQSTYGSNNSTTDASDGWRTRQTATSTSWTSVTAAEYNDSNTTSDATDGWQLVKGYSSPYSLWESTTQSTYGTNNSTTDASDGWRTRQTATSTSWTSVTATEYNDSNTTSDATDGWQLIKLYSTPYNTWESTTQSTYTTSNTVAAETDGWRTRQTATSTSWTSVTSTEYNASNLTSDATDGWQIVRIYTSPYNSWESTTQTTYNSNNSVAAETDGWRTRQTATSTSWTSITQTDYTGSNTTTDSTDGFRYTPIYSSPYSYWEDVTQAAYDAGNTTSAATDGWQTAEVVASTSWSTVTLAQYNLSNLTSDSTDGWRITNTYSSPFDIWEATSQTSYNSGNTTSDSSDGWRLVVSYTSPYSLWENITEAVYNANNTTPDNSDGWKSDHVYAEPFTAYDAGTPINKYDKDILGKFIQPVGNPVTPLTDAGGNVTNAATANLYTVSNYAQLNSGMQGIALSECGGTLTIQTRVGSATGPSALDPFTYQNSINAQTVTTTSQFRGGTYDFQTTSSVLPTVTPQDLTDLDHYSPHGWSCTAKGQPRSYTTTPVAGTPWSSITVSVAANEAVSCVQIVDWTPTP